MRRILFVDDNPYVLQGLRRTLHGARSQWALESAGGADEALALLARAPVDAVVSDIRMPRTSGAALLAAVREQHPRAARIALSGYSADQTVLDCVGPAHQFLAKPCDVARLEAALDRIFRWMDRVAGDLARAACATALLPSPAAPRSALHRELALPEPSLDEVARIVSQDAAMAAKVLQLARSDFFGTHADIISPEKAVLRLGAATMRALVRRGVLGASGEAAPAGSPGEKGSPPRRDDVKGPGPFFAPGDTGRLEALARHSRAVAHRAEAVARSQGRPEDAVEEARTAGLLHDVGLLVLAAHPGFAPAPQGSALPEPGDGHPQLGALLLALWGLPEPVVEAAAYHHDPASCPHHESGALAAVHAADALERGEGKPVLAAEGAEIAKMRCS